MKILVLGAGGMVGRRVVDEALARGHEVTAVVRRPEALSDLPDGARGHTGDAGVADDVATLGADQDVVVNATKPPPGQEAGISETTRHLLEGMARTRARLIVVGGAATLVVPDTDGRLLLDDPRYLPAEYRAIGAASAAQLDVCLADERVDWAYVSPPASLAPGERTGAYRLGSDELLVDAAGASRISVEDLAVAILDEAETPKHRRERFTVAY